MTPVTERTVVSELLRSTVWVGLGVVLLCAVLASCKGGDPENPSGAGRLVVYVYWNNQGLSEKQLEMVELHEVRITNDRGLAEFVVPAGSPPSGLQPLRVWHFDAVRYSREESISSLHAPGAWVDRR